MTFDETLEIGRNKLIEYEPRLKVLAKMPHSESFGVRHVAAHYEGSLTCADPMSIEAKITEVLDTLAEMTDGLVISEPPISTPSTSTDEVPISHGDLTIRFTYGPDVRTNGYHLWIECWFYPPDVLSLVRPHA